MSAKARPDRAALKALAGGLSKAPVTDPVIAGTTSAASHAGTAGVAGVAGNASKAKFTIRIDPDLLGRARAAYLAYGIPAGYHSLSDWIAAAIQSAVDDAEAGGELTPLGAGIVPRGPLPRR